jgi:chromate transporter
VFVMFGLSWLFAVHGDVTWIDAIFQGLAPAVIALVAWATIRIGRTSLANGVMLAVAVLAFVAIFVLHVPFPLIVLAALVIGFIGGAARPDLFDVGVAEELEEQERIALRDDAPSPAHTVPNRIRTVTTLLVGLVVWLVPIALIAAWRGPDDTLTEMGSFFSRAALITFGGAYAVLAYVNVAATQTYGFFLGAPYVETLRGNRRLGSALQTVTAAVVGVIANLAVTFAVSTLFERVGTTELLGRFEVPSPVWSSVDGFAVVAALVGFVGLWRFRWKVLAVIGASAAAGLVWYGLLGHEVAAVLR